jgi:hypothetical protein
MKGLFLKNKVGGLIHKIIIGTVPTLAWKDSGKPGNV